jgi:hypothetical protein
MSTESPKQFAVHVAAEAFRLERRQLDHDLKHGRFPNAYRDGSWMIPRADLEAAGYKTDPRWQRSHAAFVRNNKRKVDL